MVHVKDADLKPIFEREIGPEAQEADVTAGQQLIEQGIREGLEQGIREGFEQGFREGIEQGIQELLLRLLQQRFGDEVTSQVERRVATASVEQIETWTARVLSAATLAGLLAD